MAVVVAIVVADNDTDVCSTVDGLVRVAIVVVAAIIVADNDTAASSVLADTADWNLLRRETIAPLKLASSNLSRYNRVAAIGSLTVLFVSISVSIFVFSLLLDRVAMIDDDEGAAFLFAGGGHKNSDDGRNFDISPAAATAAAFFDCAGDSAATTTTLFAVLVPEQLGNGTCLVGAFRVYPFFRFDTPFLNVMLLLLMEGSSILLYSSDRIGGNLESDV